MEEPASVRRTAFSGLRAGGPPQGGGAVRADGAAVGLSVDLATTHSGYIGAGRCLCSHQEEWWSAGHGHCRRRCCGDPLRDCHRRRPPGCEPNFTSTGGGWCWPCLARGVWTGVWLKPLGCWLKEQFSARGLSPLLLPALCDSGVG